MRVLLRYLALKLKSLHYQRIIGRFCSTRLAKSRIKDLPGGCVTPNANLAAYDADCNVAEPKRSPHQTYTVGTSVDFSLGGLTPDA
ncbi:MAG: hypothetical protein CM15mP74_30550 [Halieaceae bacterium]|nr:MAG: hypothetical protein CM15mP74_30550 [Halieaceae bacterium]